MPDRLYEILKQAQQDENVRGAVLYGSRVNREIQPDPYQDYDIYFIVQAVERFDVSSISGVKLSFEPSRVYPALFPDECVYLMLFEDDSRVDLTVCTLKTFLEKHNKGELMRCLLDKDGKIPSLNQSDASGTWVSPMDEKTFQDTCSEFFWEIQNMVKGLKRDALSYAMFIRDISLRDMLNRLIDQCIGMRNEFKVSVGTLGKFRKNYLRQDEYDLYQKTYRSNTQRDRIDSLFYMLDLFSLMGKWVAAARRFDYPEEKEQVVRDYLQRVGLTGR